MKKKLLLLIPLTISLLFCSGCWDYREFENIAMVSAIGIDFNKESSEMTVTVQVIPTSNNGKSEKNSGQSSSKGTVLSAEGMTVADALANIQQGIGKNLFYGYIEIVIVSEDAAKNMMGDIIGLLDRTPDMRSTAYLLISSKKPEDVLSTFDPNITVPSAKNIYNLVKISGNTGNSYAISVQNFVKMLSVSGVEPVAPRVISQIKGGSKDSGKSGDEDYVRFDEPKEGHHIVEGIGAFQNDKFIGWLDAKESMGWAWITGKNLKTYKTTQQPGGTDTRTMRIFRITKSKSKIIVQMENDKPVVYIDVKAEADMRKSDIYSSILTPDAVKVMEKELGDSIKSDIDASIEKGQQELKSDIFGFGFAFYRENPKLWHSKYEQKWEDIFPDIQVYINVDSKVVTTGTTIKKLFIK